MNKNLTLKLCECGCGEIAPIATTSSERWKRTKGEPQRFVVGHNLRRGRPRDEPRLCGCGCGEFTTFLGNRANTYIFGHYARLQSRLFDQRWKEDETTGCHVWIGRCNTEGYGLFGHGQLAHRMAWVHANGPIPKGLVIDHLCRNPPCINVDHLEVVTQAVNMQRSKRAKLTAEDVIAIRASDDSHAALARRFGVTSTAIQFARKRLTWRNI